MNPTTVNHLRIIEQYIEKAMWQADAARADRPGCEATKDLIVALDKVWRLTIKLLEEV